MESSNLHHQHQQLQDQLVGSCSLTTPSSYAAGIAHAWTQNFALNNTTGNYFSPNCNEVILNPRPKNETQTPQLNSSMIHDFSFHWNTNARSVTSQSAHDLQLAKIKEELSDSLPKFSEMLNNPSSIEDSHLSSTSYIKNKQNDMNDLSEKLLLKTISSGFPTNGYQFSPAEIYSSPQNYSSFGNAIPSRGNFSQIYPSINISNLNLSSSPAVSGSFDMNLQALDLLTSTRFNGSFAPISHDNLGIYKEGLSFGVDRMQQSSHRPSCRPSKISSANETTKAKRSNSLIEPKATRAEPKKSRLESRASCPPFKVRKEKLGDRIAALQQLVAPFGKTDTASVLMEAIGYIKFLQNQVETLSVPYMKSTSNKTSRTMQGFQCSTAEDGNEEPRRDLKSRGLCLVPLSCMSYVTSDGGCGGIWPPPNFGGGT